MSYREMLWLCVHVPHALIILGNNNFLHFYKRSFCSFILMLSGSLSYGFLVLIASLHFIYNASQIELEDEQNWKKWSLFGNREDGNTDIYSMILALPTFLALTKASITLMVVGYSLFVVAFVAMGAVDLIFPSVYSGYLVFSIFGPVAVIACLRCIQKG